MSASKDTRTDSPEQVIAEFERLIAAASTVEEREGLYRALDGFCSRLYTIGGAK